MARHSPATITAGSRRIVLLQLTDEGRAVLRECEQAVKATEKQMMEGLELATAGAVQSHLETFVRNLRA